MILVLQSVLPIFILIILGYVFKRYLIPEESFWKNAEKITYYVLFPALLILKIGEAEFAFNEVKNGIFSVLIGTSVVALLLLLGRFVFRIENSLFTSVFQGGVRYNSYVFLGLAQALFGEKGVAISGIFVAYMIIFTNVIAVVIMNNYGSSGRKSLSSVFAAILKNPLIIGAFIGVIFNLSNITIPVIPKEVMLYLGGAASPLSLLAVGAGLTLAMHKTKVVAMCYSCFMKLLVLPIVTLVSLSMLSVTGPVYGVALLYASVPTAGNAYILATQMGGDSESMAAIITWTVLGSTLTITPILGLLVFNSP